MELKLVEIIKLNEILKRLIENSDLKLDPLFKFKLLGIMKSLESNVSNFEMIRNEKIREYGKETENGISIDPEDTDTIEKFNKSLEPLINSKVTIDIEKVKAEDIFNENLSSEWLVALYPIIEA